MKKLADIDATALAGWAITDALERAERILFGLDVGRYVVAVDEERNGKRALRPVDHAAEAARWQGSVLGHAVYCLTRYAQVGEALDAPVQEYLISLVSGHVEAVDEDLSEDPSSDLGTVVRAALGREAIEQGRPVGTAWLATLAGLTEARIRQLVAAGELEATKLARDLSITATEARRCLSGRGVPGFGKSRWSSRRTG